MRNPWLCLIIVGALASPVIALSACGVMGRDPGAALVEMAKYCSGALAAFLVQIPRGSVGAPAGHQPTP